ncbi:hypothetical protein GGH12_002114 [Coemansia sp. RSA 1822]|nr:hypothetical protein GGH12_002114 [Coemansia sp. RSA 1822]
MLENDENKPPQPSGSDKPDIVALMQSLINSQKERDRRQEERDKRQEERDKRQEERDKERDKRQEDRDKRQEDRDKALNDKLSVLADSMKVVTDSVDNLQKNMLRTSQHHAAPVSFSALMPIDEGPFASPTGGRTQRVSGLEAPLSTPIKLQKVAAKYDTAHYHGLGSEYDSEGVRTSQLLERLGEGWLDAYNAVSDADCAAIANSTRGFCRRCNYSDLGPEKHRQTVVHELFGAIEALLMPQRTNGTAMLRWEDRHDCPMSNGRKPDGILQARVYGLDTDWQSVVVSVELKSADHSHGDNHLRGQIFQNFLDMSEDQPRRYMLGLAVAGKCQARAYLCTPSGVVFSNVGLLQSAGDVTAEHKNFIRFIMVLYKMLPHDYGFLPLKECGVLDRFMLKDIPNCELPDTDTSNMTVTVSGRKTFGGRHAMLIGPQSWIYRAQIGGADGSTTSAIFKFIWHPKDGSEVAVHKKVQEMGIPYIPRLLHSATIAVRNQGQNSEEKLQGEILVIEDAGLGVYDFALNAIRDGRSNRLVDIFAGYMHTLLAAASADEHTYVLHRDVSIGNLFVCNNQPVVIDWGCGMIAQRTVARTPSDIKFVGTAPFMGIRVLQKSPIRTIIDDLESLFLVLAHIVWNVYGTRSSNYQTLWGRASEMVDVADARTLWLGSETELINRMGFKEEESVLVDLVKRLYKLLFPVDIRISEISESPSDPRLAKFRAKKWLEEFESAAKKSSVTEMPCLVKLREFVEANPRLELPRNTFESGKRKTGDRRDSSFFDSAEPHSKK